MQLAKFSYAWQKQKPSDLPLLTWMVKHYKYQYLEKVLMIDSLDFLDSGTGLDSKRLPMAIRS